MTKEEYWKNRKIKVHVKNDKGKIIQTIEKLGRGQNSYIPEPKIIKQTTKFNRRVRRHKSVSRAFTKKNYAFGLKIGSKEYNITHHIAKRQTE